MMSCPGSWQQRTVVHVVAPQDARLHAGVRSTASVRGPDAGWSTWNAHRRPKALPSPPFWRRRRGQDLQSSSALRSEARRVSIQHRHVDGNTAHSTTRKHDAKRALAGEAPARAGALGRRCTRAYDPTCFVLVVLLHAQPSEKARAPAAGLGRAVDVDMHKRYPTAQTASAPGRRIAIKRRAAYTALTPGRARYCFIAQVLKQRPPGEPR